MKRKIVTFWVDSNKSEMYVERAGGVMRMYRLSYKNLLNLKRAWNSVVRAQEGAAARRLSL